ncbi:MAG: ribbon-helix-helix protein, CopG family [Planctomycetaceae bacterium]
MRTISLKLPPELDQRLTELAEQRGMSRSAVLREALETFTNGRTGSVTSLAGNLVGSLEGPRDLSTASDSMQGYGR